jgi:hypothetical protein
MPLGRPGCGIYLRGARKLDKRFIVRMYYIICMKGIWLVLLILVTTGICTAEFPYLVGNWTGSQNTYVAENGSYKLLENQSTSLAIIEQKDRLFTGYVTYPSDGKEIVENLAGAISLDNKTFYVAELNEGYDIGTIISDDEIELIYLADGENGRTVINTLYRIKE